MRYYLVSDVINDLYINTVLWLVLNYFSYLDQSQICVWGSRHLCFLFHTSCMKEVLNRIRWILSTLLDLVHRILSRSLDQTSCLTTAFLKTLSFCVFFVYAYQRQTWSDRSGKGLSERAAETKDWEYTSPVRTRPTWAWTKGSLDLIRFYLGGRDSLVLRKIISRAFHLKKDNV